MILPGRITDIPAQFLYRAILVLAFGAQDKSVVEKDIAFGPEPYQKVDLYRPSGEGPFPVVVCFYGGGFTQGSKAGMATVARHLASRGIAAAAPNYLLADLAKGRPAWPGSLHDAKAVVRFLRARSKELALDPDRIAALGSSSGAYLALMVGFTPHLKELEGTGGWADPSSAVIAVVNIAGVCDRREGLGTGTRNLLGEGYEGKADLRRLASPVVHVGPKSPPVYTLHGEADDNVSPDSARQLDDALKKAGVPHTLHLVPGAGHNPLTAETLKAVGEWLSKQLRPGAK